MLLGFFIQGLIPVGLLVHQIVELLSLGPNLGTEDKKKSKADMGLAS